MKHLNIFDNWYFNKLVEGGKDFEYLVKVIPTISLLGIAFTLLLIVILTSLYNRFKYSYKVVPRKGDPARSEWGNNYSYYSNRATRVDSPTIPWVKPVLVVRNLLMVIVGLVGVVYVFMFVIQDYSSKLTTKISEENIQQSVNKTGEVEGVIESSFRGEITHYILPTLTLEAYNLDRGREGDIVLYKEHETYKFNDSGRYVPTKEGLIQEINYLEREEEEEE